MLAADNTKRAPAGVASAKPLHELSPLFEDVQRSGIFEDAKTFADSTPRRDVQEILREYVARKSAGNPIDLAQFVRQNFAPPESRHDIAQHIAAVWDLLRRAPDPHPTPGSSLLPLPEPYVVPGGRFRETYYWDSYFTMLGLRASGRTALVASMVRNFVHLISRFGYVPNGNRTYYLSRSQPPFFSRMLELLGDIEGPAVLTAHEPVLRAEYDYWMDGSAAGRGHAVRLADGSILNRYYDQLCEPRPEAFAIDEAIARRTERPAAEVYRDLRSAAESGWDFSSRWLSDPRRIETIRTTDFIPIDLNCLLFGMERTLARMADSSGARDRALQMHRAAENRRAALGRHCWHEDLGFFCDYDLRAEAPCARPTLAGLFPLYVGLASPEQAGATAEYVAAKFLAPGGLVTTITESGQQWDWPNGWAPLQWVAIVGLRAYGFIDLAETIARRWIQLNRDVYERTGRLMEKYNVVDITKEAGGGEYPTQDGFGWTNGVLLALLERYSPLLPPKPS